MFLISDLYPNKFAFISPGYKIKTLISPGYKIKTKQFTNSNTVTF